MAASELIEPTDVSICGPGNLNLGWSCTAPNMILCFLAWCLLSAIARKIIIRLAPSFREAQTLRHQRNIVSYVVGLLVKTVSFVTVLAAGAPLLFLNEPLSDYCMRLCLAGGFLLVTTFYIWEMIYRIDMDIMLLIHHLTTLILVVLSTAGSFNMKKKVFGMEETEGLSQAMEMGRLLMIRITLVELVAASTNQPVLVALLLHRAKFSASRRAFLAAGLWELVSKNLRLILVMILYFTGAYTPLIGEHCHETPWCMGLRITYPVLAIVIWLSNMHMVYLLWSLARRDNQHISDKVASHCSTPDPDGKVLCGVAEEESKGSCKTSA
mmetsp:Transcript_105448/g.191779  ORF Transcript_105448/g.191779 Transcript_105448/m.191779 type:complete len:325 (-) Transcript_105448:55-1029(-)